jgi:hypothetical protein
MGRREEPHRKRQRNARHKKRFTRQLKYEWLEKRELLAFGVLAGDAEVFAFPRDLTVLEGGTVEVDLGTLIQRAEAPPTELKFEVNDAFHGSVELLEDGRTARFTPNPEFNGLAGFDYLVTVIAVGRVWHNEAMPPDVNNDGQISPIDALITINHLNDVGPQLLGNVPLGQQFPAWRLR